MKRSLLSVALLLAFPVLVRAEVKLASYFGDGMVLQRGRPVVVWGQADSGASVAVTLGGQKKSVAADNAGKWSVMFDALKPGEPIALEAASNGKTTRVKDVLVGDVWLCSGQSNMQMSLQEAQGGMEAAKKIAGLKSLRLCSVGRGAAGEPQDKADIKWRPSTEENALKFSAVGSYFVMNLLEEPALKDVPVGVIDATFGGTTVEGWTPPGAMAAIDPKQVQDSMFGIKASALYNAMIHPLGVNAPKGVVWYQGEGNSGEPAAYTKKLINFMGAWRERFGSPELPFIIVSLPDHTSRWNDLFWCWFREAQEKAVKATPGAAIALAINTNDGTDLHPKEKAEIGRRAALIGRADVYGAKVVARGPVFQSMTVEGNKVVVTFDSVDEVTTSDGKGPRGFMVAGEDGKYFYADAVVSGGNTVTVSSEHVSSPKTVRYAWAGVPNSTLVNKSGLPAYPFRTDDFPIGDREMLTVPGGRTIATTAYEAEVGANGMLVSLTIGGKEFLSSDKGLSAGTSIPMMFGARSLPNIVELAPDVLSAGDNDLTILYTFEEKQVKLAITSKTKDDIHFRLCLSPGVKVSAKSADGAGAAVTLTRQQKTTTLSGVDKISDDGDAKLMEVTIKANQSKVLVFSLR